MSKRWGGFLGMVLFGVVLSGCGRQPPLPDVLPQKVEKQCLDTAQEVSDCK